jgi:hypothetical protein
LKNFIFISLENIFDFQTALYPRPKGAEPLYALEMTTNKNQKVYLRNWWPTTNTEYNANQYYSGISTISVSDHMNKDIVLFKELTNLHKVVATLLHNRNHAYGGIATELAALHEVSSWDRYG